MYLFGSLTADGSRWSYQLRACQPLTLGYACPVIFGHQIREGKGFSFVSTIEFDEQLLLSGQQRDDLLDWVGQHPRNGRTLRAFFSAVAFAALRPGEALALRVRDVQLPDDGPGVLVVHARRDGTVEGGREGTGIRRVVPVCPRLVELLKEQIVARELGPDDAVFLCDDGRPLSGAMYRRAWKQACEGVLESRGTDSTAGVNVSVLRDVCIWVGEEGVVHPRPGAEHSG